MIKKIGSYCVWIPLVLVFLTLAGVVYAIQCKTLINFWLPFSVAAVVALPVAAVCGKSLGKRSLSGIVAVDYAIYWAMLLSFFLFLFYFSNSHFAKEGSLHKEKVVVERVYSETHYRSKRISRNRHVRGEPYKLYYIDVAFQSGHSKKLSVDLHQYRRIDRGDTLTLDVEKGLWGIAVIRRDGHNIEVPRKKGLRRNHLFRRSSNLSNVD